ncbi:MAG: serine protease [Pirellulaceae bacterium]
MGPNQLQGIPFQSLKRALLKLGITQRAVISASCQVALVCLCVATVSAQSVCLPAPRLLTTMPMGAQVGSEVSVTIRGDFLENPELLSFSDPGIAARPKLDAAGKSIDNQFLVTVAADLPPGVYEARVMTRLGLSSSRAFSIGTLPEVVREKPNIELAHALDLAIDTLCNAYASPRAMDHYAIELAAGSRVFVDCAAAGIDSKLKPVVILADSAGRDLVVERRGGVLEFTAPTSGRYIVKIHDLTFQGGEFYFYRLSVRAAESGKPFQRMPTTLAVNACSWPPAGLSPVALAGTEVEPTHAARIDLPCDIAGSFFPAADVDTFEFMAKQGEVWWVEVASHRLGLSTDPSALVQRAVHGTQAGAEPPTWVDVAELKDIGSPIKPSSNAYAYDGPPYDAGSTDILGSFEVNETGLHRLQLRDLFGGTRSDPHNVYRLIIRQATPDFALAAWALHMELRNGDRNALSKPIALRRGATIALEVAAVRRDGFAGPIELTMDNLPNGVSATGLTIPAGQTRGIVLLTAAEDAPRGFTSAVFVGTAEIEGTRIQRPCHLASMAWPVPDAWQEIPSPRLLADVPISVADDVAPLSIVAAEEKHWEVEVGQSLTIPLKLTRRMQFSGASTKMKTFGHGFESQPPFTIPLDQDTTEVVLDLAKLKTPPGDYTVAFYGSAVAKYAHNPGAIQIAESAIEKKHLEAALAEAEVAKLDEALRTLAANSENAAAPTDALSAVAAAKEKHQQLLLEESALVERLKQVKQAAQPKDIVDIVVSVPIHVRVKPAEAP